MDQDQPGRSRSRRDRLPNPGEIAAWSKTYWTSFEQRPGGTTELTSAIDVPKSLRRRLSEGPPPFLGEFGSWAVDATAKELHVWFARPDTEFADKVIALRCKVWSAFEKANNAVKPLKQIAVARQRLRDALPHLDDLIALLDRASTGYSLEHLPSALTQLGEGGAHWINLLSTLEQLGELRSTVASAAKRDQKRGSKGTPFEDAFIRELAEIWQTITKSSPPKVVKETKSRRTIGYLFHAFVDEAFSDIRQPKRGLAKRIRRILSTPES
jgi:hypothetical protein